MRQLRSFRAWMEAPDSPTPLGWFRIGVALFCLFKLWTIRHSILDVYGQYGFVQWAITRGTLPEGVPHLGNVAIFLRGAGLSADQSVYAVVFVYSCALVLLLLGILSRCAASLAWCLGFLLMYAGGGLLYGMDYFTHIALFYCMIMPTGDAVSLPVALGWRRPLPSVAAGVTRKMLQLQLCIVYCSSGLEKALGIEWWNGEAVWRALSLPVFRTFDIGGLSVFPFIPMVAGWSVIVIEAAYPLMIWLPRTRAAWLFLVLALHLGIGMFMGMWLFALIMILLNAAAFGPEIHRSFVQSKS